MKEAVRFWHTRPAVSAVSLLCRSAFLRPSELLQGQEIENEQQGDNDPKDEIDHRQQTMREPIEIGSVDATGLECKEDQKYDKEDCNLHLSSIA